MAQCGRTPLARTERISFCETQAACVQGTPILPEDLFREIKEFKYSLTEIFFPKQRGTTILS
jgi:hypothetical protein